MNVALLPMKVHSERVPGKNFRLLGGKPLYRWILDTLLGLEFVDLVVINTDGREIFNNNGLPESKKILVRDRAPEICGDFVSMNRVIEDDVNHVEADVYLMTHATNPFLSAKTIEGAYRTFIDSRDKNDSLFTVNRVQSRFYRPDGSAVNHNPNQLIRTQDLELWLEENSNLYIFTRESFRSANARIGKNPILYSTERLESLDIDDQSGWDLAEAVANRYTR